MTMTRTACALALLACAAPGWAQYRCGNSFQDRPCDAGVAEQRVGPGTRAPSPATPAPAPAAAQTSPYAGMCARQGERAQQMAWKREAGATLDKQLAELPNDGQRAENAALLQSVYGHRGSAPQIRVAIEAECVAERQRQADAAQLLKALQGPAGQTVPAPAAAVRTIAEPQQAQQATSPSAANTKARCDALRERKDRNDAALRRGGSVGTMESLHDERRSIDRAMSEVRC